MSAGLHVEVRVRGRVDGEVLALVGDGEVIQAEVVPRHTVLTVAREADAGAGELVAALLDAGVELDRVLPCHRGS